MAIDIDKWNQHDINLHRLSTNNVNSVVIPNLNAVDVAIADLLNSNATIKTKGELASITKAIREQINAQDTWAITTVNLTEMAVYEATWQAEFMGAAFATKMQIPGDSSIVRYIQQSIMSLTSGDRVDAGIWSKFVNDNLSSQNKHINNIVTKGFAKGQTRREISTQISKTYDTVLKREAESLARTGFIHYAAQTNEAMIQDNTDVLKEYYYVTVFDNRKSAICRGIEATYNADGSRFKVGDPRAISIPAHYMCRTRRIAVPYGWRPNGDKGSVGGKDTVEAQESFDKRKGRAGGGMVKYRGRKDKAFTAKPIKATTSEDKWLRRQPTWYIHDTLGKGFGNAFIKGSPLKSFSDLSGRPLTFTQFKARV